MGASGSIVPRPTVRENVERMLRFLGFSGHLTVTHCSEDRVWAWPNDDFVLRTVVLDGWKQDLVRIAEAFHGCKVSFREPGDPSPCMQISFHRSPGPDYPWDYFLEIDLDYGSPYGLKGSVVHLWEVVRNAVSGRKTDQSKVSSLLDRRGVPK